jgi:hypothetical protein
VRRATQGPGAYGPNEFRRAVGRSHLSPPLAQVFLPNRG